MRIRNSFWARLVQQEVSEPEAVLESIRQAMLRAIDELHNPHVRALDDDIGNAIGISDLWNLRTRLLHAIAAEQGKEVARHKVNEITGMFRDY